jgi:hypothetical protein
MWTHVYFLNTWNFVPYSFAFIFPSHFLFIKWTLDLWIKFMLFNFSLYFLDHDFLSLSLSFYVAKYVVSLLHSLPQSFQWVFTLATRILTFKNSLVSSCLNFILSHVVDVIFLNSQKTFIMINFGDLLPSYINCVLLEVNSSICVIYWLSFFHQCKSMASPHSGEPMWWQASSVGQRSLSSQLGDSCPEWSQKWPGTLLYFLCNPRVHTWHS